MPKEMLINVSEGEECRIALIEDGKLEELYMERTSFTSHVGNIYKGKVTNVEPSIQAAFIDFGLGRNGFLHISDLMPTYFGGPGEDVQETVGRKMARRDRPPIQRCLRRGDEIVVQIIKEGIGTKGPTLSTYLAVPGRILVMMPGMAKMGVSRKIEDDDERRRLRQILDSLEPIPDVGFIIRTAGVGKTKAEIQRDLTYLTRLWQGFVKKRDSGPGPMELYTEGDLVSRTVRDVFTTDVDRIVVDNKEVVKRVKDVVKLANPRTRNKVELYEDPIPLFHKAGIEAQIEQMHSRHVPLPSGGSLVIDSTEAIVAIDVNSGKFRDHADAETTAFRTDMEAADEIPRQLRLRDLGGVIICDFIDLRYERHRRELEQRLHENFQKDRAKTRVLRMSQFGIIEITRQRMRPSLKRSIYSDCPHCKGAGLVKTPESMSLDVMRRLAIAISDGRVARVDMSVCPDVAFYLQNKKRWAISDLESRFNKRIVIKPDAALGLDEAQLTLLDAREGQVYLAELGMTPQPPAGVAPPRGGRGGRPDDRGRHDSRRDGGRDGGRGRDRDQSRHQQPARRDEAHDEGRDEEDSHSIDQVEQDVEQREDDIEGTSEEVAGGPPLQAPVAPAPAEGGPPRNDSFGDGAPRQEDQSGYGEDGGRRRRRRRRRRRGRGGGGGGDFGGRPPQGDFYRAPQQGGGSQPQPQRPMDRDRDRDRDRDSNRDRDGNRRDGGGNREGNRGGPHRAPDRGYFRGRDGNRDRNLQGQEQAVETGFIEEYDTGPDEAELPPPPPSKAIAPVTPQLPREQPPAPVGPEVSDGPGEGDLGDQGGPATQGGEGDAGELRRRRRRRGGRGRNRGRRPADSPAESGGESSGDEAASEPAPAEPKPVPAAEEPARAAKPSRRRGGSSPRRKPPAAASQPAAPQPPVVRTGSADKHLASDDPVAPQPVSRPRSFVDLDHIPDDFD